MKDNLGYLVYDSLNQGTRVIYYDILTEKDINDSIITRLIIYEIDIFGSITSCESLPFVDQPQNKEAIRKHIDDYLRDDGKGGKLPPSAKTPPYIAYDINSKSKEPEIVSK